jgi:hypothetical protein
MTLGALGAISEHNQQRANAFMQEDQARYNQRLAEREAEIIEQETLYNTALQQQESARLLSAQRAALGTAGAALDSGSPLALQGATAAMEQRKANSVLRSGYMQQSQALEKAKMYGYSATVARASAPSGAQLALNIGNSLLRGASTNLSLASSAKQLWGN